METLGYVLTAIAIVLLIVVIVMLVIIMKKKSSANSATDNSQTIINMIRDTDTSLGRAIERNNGITIGNIETLRKTITDLNETYNKFMIYMNEQMERIRKDNSEAMLKMREDNSKEMEKIREVVDQKLSENIEQKFNASFKQVSERIAELAKGFGELQSLQSSVKDLNSMFHNVSTRGTWGEIQLESLLSQILAPEQYEKQYKINPKSDEKVDFAIKIPTQGNEIVLLPLDSKFPLESYQRVVAASAAGDKEATDFALKELATTIKNEAKSIHDKYILPPKTTDFAVMYLTIEGLYAEVAKQPGLLEELHNKYNVIVSGPTTLAALLNSMRIAFESVAIQKRSKEIADIMRKFQKDFASFAKYLDKMGDNLSTMQKSLEGAKKKNEHISKTLSKVKITDGTGQDYIDVDDEANPTIGLIEDENNEDL